MAGTWLGRGVRLGLGRCFGKQPDRHSFFVAFDDDALREIGRFFKADHPVIVPLTVQEILGEKIARKLA